MPLSSVPGQMITVWLWESSWRQFTIHDSVGRSFSFPALGHLPRTDARPKNNVPRSLGFQCRDNTSTPRLGSSAARRGAVQTGMEGCHSFANSVSTSFRRMFDALR